MMRLIRPSSPIMQHQMLVERSQQRQSRGQRSVSLKTAQTARRQRSFNLLIFKSDRLMAQKSEAADIESVSQHASCKIKD